MGSLSGKTAIVTGAGRGIGKAIASKFLAEGAQVIASDIDPAGKDGIVKLGGTFLTHDVSSAADWEKVARAALERGGSIDVLVNNAGIYKPLRLQDLDEAEFERHWRVNELGAFLGMKAVIGTMMEKRKGSIINMSSTAGVRGVPQILAYSTNKWALRGMTKSSAHDLGPYNIRVNAIEPAGIVTEMRAVLIAENPAFADASNFPLGRFGSTEEVADLALYLASDTSSFITGADFVIDGGRFA
jgi:3alpha(or 20beta)-hydroxysteroid dehydrogenase